MIKHQWNPQINEINNTIYIRDRPFNLQGGYGFLFRSGIFFWTTQEFEYLFFLSRKFIPEFNIRLFDKNSESDFFFLHQNQNILFSNIGNQNIFLERMLSSLRTNSLLYCTVPCFDTWFPSPCSTVCCIILTYQCFVGLLIRHIVSLILTHSVGKNTI